MNQTESIVVQFTSETPAAQSSIIAAVNQKIIESDESDEKKPLPISLTTLSCVVFSEQLVNVVNHVLTAVSMKGQQLPSGKKVRF